MITRLLTQLALDPETIGMAFNIAFFAFLGFIAIGFLVGLIRGMWKSGFRLIIVGGLVIAAFLLARPLTDIIANIDIGAILTSFGISIPQINITLGESAIILNITTIQATLTSFFDQLVVGLGLAAGSASELSTLVLALTLVVMRYVVFIVLGFVIVTVGELLATILYFFPFRLFIPKKWRKHHKVRLIGGLLNAVKVALVSVMMLVPFSSILNTINQALHNDNNGVAEGIDDPTYNQIMSFMDAYNDSLFAQLLFNWSVSADGKTLDTILMDYVTGEDVDGYMLTLSNELYTMTSIGQSIMSTGILTNGLTDATTNALLSENVMTSVITNVFGSTLVMKALPVAISIAMNMDLVQQYVDPDLIDLTGIDWQDEIINVKEIALDVLDSGIIDNIINNPGEIDPLALIVDMVGEEAYPSIRSALHRIDDSAFLRQVLPAVVYKMVNDEVAAGPTDGLGLSTFFPTVWADYEDLRFGEEIALIYDVIHNIANLDPDLLPAIIDIAIPAEPAATSLFDYDFVTDNGGRIKKLNTPTITTPRPADPASQDVLIDIVRAHSDELIEIIVGALDNGIPTGIDPDTGKTILFDGEGQPLPGVTANLLDSSILLNGLDELMEMAMEPLVAALSGGLAFNRTKLDAALVALNGITNGEKRFNYKGEFGSILGIITALFGNDTLLSLIFPSEEAIGPLGKSGPKREDPPADPTSDLLTLFEDDEFRNAFKDDICPLLDRSMIMGAVIPSVLEAAFTGEGMNGMLEPLGLVADDLNFDFDDVGTQMAILIDIIGYSLGVVDSIDTIFEDISPVVDDLIGLLDSIYTSDIFNPKDEVGALESENYYNMLSSLFGNAEALSIDMDEFDDIIRTIPVDGWTTTYDELGDPIVKGENYNLIKFIETALTSDLFNIDTNGDVLDQMISFASDPDDPIGKIFDAVDSSIIISSTFGGILDNLFGSSAGLIDPALGTSFRNVTDWSAEGQNLKYILNSLEPFLSGIENIDFMNDDPVKVENILKALAQSQIFITSSDEYVFSDFLLNKLKGGSSILGDYLLDPYEDDTDPSPYDRVTADFHAVGQTSATASNWYGDDGEIDKIVAFVSAIQDFSDGAADPMDKLQNDPTITSADVKPIMVSLNDIGSMRILLYNILTMIFEQTDQFNVGTLVVSESNSYILLTMDEKADRLVEIDILFDIYATLESMGLNDGGSFSMDTFTTETIADLDSMLNDMHDTKIFNTFDTSFEPRSYALGFLTVFEQVIEMVFDASMIDSYIYKELGDENLIDAALRADIMAIPNNFGDYGNPLDEWVGPTGEIKSITDIFVSFKETDLTFSDFGNDGANAMSDLLGDPAGLAKLETLILDINDSRLAYPAIPNLFDEIFTAGSFAISGVDLADANTDFFRNEPVASERAPEIVLLLDIYENINDLGLTDGAALNPATIDPANIELMLINIHDSFVFNSFQSGKNYVTLDLTVFEQVVNMVFDSSMMDSYIHKELGDENLIDAAMRDDIMAINNNFADYGNPGDEWVGVNGEIRNIKNILSSFKDTDLTFDDFGNDGANAMSTLLDDPAGTAKLETLLLDINESRLAHLAIPNLFDEIFTAGSFAISGVDLSDANTDFFRNEPMASERATEITLLLDVYQGISDLNLTDGAALDPANIDSVTIEDMLNNLHDSFVFNSFQSGKSHVTLDMTVFEQVVNMVFDTSMMDSYIHKELGDENLINAAMRDDIMAINNNFADYGNPGDEWVGLTGEIKNITTILASFKDTNLSFDDFGNDGANAISGLLGDPVGMSNLQTLLLDINESRLAHPAIANLFDEIFLSGSFALSGVDLDDANTDFFRTEPMASERATEIVLLLDIYDGIDALSLTDGAALDPLNIDAGTIDDMLNNLHDSRVFNTFKAGNSHLTMDMTVFEQTIWMLIDTSQLDEYIYEGIGRDPALNEDIIAIGNNFAATQPLNDDGWIDQVAPVTVGEISRIVGILDSFKDSGLTFASFSGAGSNAVLSDLMDSDSSAVENMLLAMNRSQIAYPAIPNLFDNMLTAGAVSISGIDFAAANTHYRGNRGDPLVDDKYLPYDEPEISQMLVIFNDTKDLTSIDYTDLSGLDNSSIDLIQGVAESLFESNVFHQAGASTNVDDDPTVFEQIMIKMMNETGLSSLVNDTLNPNPEYYDGLIYKFATAAEKAEYIVVNFDDLYGASVDYHTNAWDGASGEINNFFRIFKEFKRILPASASVGSLTPSALTPNEISSMLAVLNYSTLSADAIPYLVRDAFETISFDTYTEGNEDYYLTPVEYFDVDLTTMDYTGTDFTNLNPPAAGSMGIIEELLSEFHDGVAYEDMGAGFDIGNFISSGHTTEPLLHLLKSSKVFTNDMPAETYKTRSLTLYNILEPIDVVKYIDTNNPLTNKTSKVNKLETIFVTDFDYVFEAERLDDYIENLISLNTIGDASSISGLGTEFRALIETTYIADISEAITDRAYLVSELSAGFYTDIFEEEYAKAAPPTPDEIDFYANDYANLNPKEADGIEGSLSIIDEMDIIIGGVFDETDVARLRGHFVKMGSLVRTSVADGPYPAAYDFTAYDIDGNSLIAKLFYAAEIVPSGSFANFSAALTAYAWSEKMAIVTLDIDPYAVNFVFEIEGDKIYYVYE